MRKTIIFSVGFFSLIFFMTSAFSCRGTVEANIFDGVDLYYGHRVIESFIELTSNDGSTTFLKPGVRFQEERVLYFFVFYLYAYDWFSIEKVSIDIDNEHYLYNSADEARNVIVNGIVKELVTYYTTENFLRKLSEANTVMIRIEGREGFKEFPLAEAERELLGVLLHYIDSIFFTHSQ